MLRRDFDVACQRRLSNVVNNALAVQERRMYAPYGESYDGVGTSQTVYGFTGEPTDANALVYLRARYLNPGLGVFASRDPWEGVTRRPMSLNGYSWVEGNVVNTVDPSGKCMTDIPCGLLPEPFESQMGCSSPLGIAHCKAKCREDYLPYNFAGYVHCLDFCELRSEFEQPPEEPERVFIFGARLDVSGSWIFGFDINIEIQCAPYYFQQYYWGERSACGFVINDAIPGRSGGEFVAGWPNLNANLGVILGNAPWAQVQGEFTEGNKTLGISGELGGIGGEIDVTMSERSFFERDIRDWDFIVFAGYGLRKSANPMFPVSGSLYFAESTSTFFDPIAWILEQFK